MYNEELKNRFIREEIRSDLTAEDYRILFNSIQKYEEEWDADICTRTAEELRPVIESLAGIRENSRRVRLGFIRSYVRWCIKNNIGGACDGALTAEISGSDNIRTMMVSGPKHLQRCLDEICDPVEENTIDCIYRCYYWLVFGGAKEDDILNISVKDVDLQSMSVHCKGMEIPIYREAIGAFRNASALTEFVYKNNAYSKPITRNRFLGDALIRGFRSLPSLMAMRVELSRRQRKAVEEGRTNMKLSYSRVRLSGIFYRQYENERAGMAIDFYDTVNLYTDGREYKLDSCGKTQEGKRRQLEREFRIDYDNWKKAFSCI